MTTSRLTPRALSKLHLLTEAEIDARTISSNSLRRISELRNLISLAGEDANVANYEAEIARLQDKQLHDEERRLQLAFINMRLRNFADALPPHVVIEDAARPKVKLKSGDTPVAAVERIRREIADMTTRRRAVENCGLPIDEMQAQARKWVEERGRKAAPRLRADHYNGFSVDLAATQFDMKISVQDVLCWFDPEGVILRLNEAIDAMPKPALAMTPAEKQQALATIAAAMLDLELLEEAHIDAASQGGTTIVRRPDVGPAAVLGLTISIQAAKAA